MKISYKVPLTASAIILLAFLGFAWLQFNSTYKSLYAKIQAHVDETSVVLSKDIATWLGYRLAVINAISESVSDDFNTISIRRILRADSFASDFIMLFSGSAVNGETILSDAAVDLPPGFDSRTRPWYQLALTSDATVLTEPYQDGSNQARGLLITAAKKVIDPYGSVVAVIGGDLNLQTISNNINAINFNQAGYAYLVNKNGKIISHPDSNLYDKNISALYSETQPQITQQLQESKSDGKNVLTAFYPIDKVGGTNWYIGVVIDKNAALNDAYRLGQNAIFTAIIASLIASFVLYLLMNILLIKPVQRLTQASEDISRGDMGVKLVDVGRKDEIGQLALAVQRLQKSLNMALSRLGRKK